MYKQITRQELQKRKDELRKRQGPPYNAKWLEQYHLARTKYLLGDDITNVFDQLDLADKDKLYVWHHVVLVGDDETPLEYTPLSEHGIRAFEDFYPYDYPDPDECGWFDPYFEIEDEYDLLRAHIESGTGTGTSGGRLALINRWVDVVATPDVIRNTIDLFASKAWEQKHNEQSKEGKTDE